MQFRLLVMTLALAYSATFDAAGPAAPQISPDENRPQSERRSSDDNFKIKVDVDLVTTELAIIGGSETQFRAEDFTIYDNNVAQPATFFSRAQLPLAVAILIDRSDSTMMYLPVLKIAGLSALRRLKQEDRVALFSFDEMRQKLCDLTEDRLQIAEKIGQIALGGYTNIYDAIYEASQYLKNRAPGFRRAIVLISDNGHNAYESRQNAHSCNKELMETSTTLYNILIQAPGRRMRYWEEEEESVKIQKLAKETGGDVLNVQEPASIKAALEQAFFRLRTQYTIGFSPSNPGSPGSLHKLSVRFTGKDRCPKCSILARKGYYAGIPAAPPPPAAPPAPSKYSPQKMDQLLMERMIYIAGTTSIEIAEIPFKFSYSERTNSSGERQLKIDLQIDPAAIDLTEAGERHGCQLIIAVFYANPEGTGLGSRWWKLENQPNAEERQPVMKSPLPLSVDIPLKMPGQNVKIVVYDQKSDKIGSKFIQIGSAAQKSPAKR